MAFHVARREGSSASVPLLVAAGQRALDGRLGPATSPVPCRGRIRRIPPRPSVRPGLGGMAEMRRERWRAWMQDRRSEQAAGGAQGHDNIPSGREYDPGPILRAVPEAAARDRVVSCRVTVKASRSEVWRCRLCDHHARSMSAAGHRKVPPRSAPPLRALPFSRCFTRQDRGRRAGIGTPRCPWRGISAGRPQEPVLFVRIAWLRLRRSPAQV